MSATTTAKALPEGIVAGKKYRIRVKNAEEAVETLRERLGPTAKVLSVETVEEKGLGRILGSPKLEIIAMVPQTAPEMPAPRRVTLGSESSPGATKGVGASATGDEAGRQSSEEKSLRQKRSDGAGDAVAHGHSIFEGHMTSHERMAFEGESAKSGQSPSEGRSASYGHEGSRGQGARHPWVSPPGQPPDGFQGRMREKATGERGLPSGEIWEVLGRSGFPSSFLAEMRFRGTRRKLEDLPIGVALGEFVQTLRAAYHRLPEHPLRGPVAFMGAPGVGTTTVLQKVLGEAVLRRHERPTVAKLETEEPNAGGALSAFAEALGVDFQHLGEGSVERFRPDLEVLLDVPGMPVNDASRLATLGSRLDALGIGPRVLVLHAACETEYLERCLLAGQRLGATHLALAHGDEVVRAARLWPLVLHSGLSPLLVSLGPSPAGEFTEDGYAFLLERTFPQAVRRGAGSW